MNSPHGCTYLVGWLIEMQFFILGGHTKNVWEGGGGEWEGHAGDNLYPCMTLRQSDNVQKWQTNKLVSVQILKKESLPQLVQISL